MAQAKELERAHYVWSVDPGQLVVEMERNGRRFVPKPSDRDVQELKDSLLRAGRQLQPAGVAKLPDGRIRLVYGYRRWLAIQLIREAKLVAPDHPLWQLQVTWMDSKPMTDQDEFLANVTENADRKSLTVMDNAANAARLQDEFGMAQKDIARRLHVDTSRVNQLLRIMKLPLDAQRMVETGKIAAATAYELSDMDEQTLAGYLERLKNGGTLSRDQVRVDKYNRTAAAVEAAQSGSGAPEGTATVVTTVTAAGGTGGTGGAGGAGGTGGTESALAKKRGPKQGAVGRSWKVVAAELEEYATPAEGADPSAVHSVMAAVVMYVTGKRTASWLVRRVEEAVG